MSGDVFDPVYRNRRQNIKIDLNELAHFVETTLDYSPDYEDDAFAFTFAGERVYCERHRYCFKLEVGAERFQLPR